MNTHLYFASQTAKVKLPSPRLARTSGNCQQNAYVNADATAPLLKSKIFIESPPCFKKSKP